MGPALVESTCPPMRFNENDGWNRRLPRHRLRSILRPKAPSGPPWGAFDAPAVGDLLEMPEGERSQLGTTTPVGCAHGRTPTSWSMGGDTRNWQPLAWPGSDRSRDSADGRAHCWLVTDAEPDNGLLQGLKRALAQQNRPASMHIRTSAAASWTVRGETLRTCLRQPRSSTSLASWVGPTKRGRPVALRRSHWRSGCASGRRLRRIGCGWSRLTRYGWTRATPQPAPHSRRCGVSAGPWPSRRPTPSAPCSICRTGPTTIRSPGSPRCFSDPPHRGMPKSWDCVEANYGRGASSELARLEARTAPRGPLGVPTGRP